MTTANGDATEAAESLIARWEAENGQTETIGPLARVRLVNAIAAKLWGLHPATTACLRPDEANLKATIQDILNVVGLPREAFNIGAVALGWPRKREAPRSPDAQPIRDCEGGPAFPSYAELRPAAPARSAEEVFAACLRICDDVDKDKSLYATEEGPEIEKRIRALTGRLTSDRSPDASPRVETAGCGKCTSTRGADGRIIGWTIDPTCVAHDGRASFPAPFPAQRTADAPPRVSPEYLKGYDAGVAFSERLRAAEGWTPEMMAEVTSYQRESATTVPALVVGRDIGAKTAEALAAAVRPDGIRRAALGALQRLENWVTSSRVVPETADGWKYLAADIGALAREVRRGASKRWQHRRIVQLAADMHAAMGLSWIDAQPPEREQWIALARFAIARAEGGR